MFGNRNLKNELTRLREIVNSQANQINELSERLDSRAYYDMVGRYEVKEKRFCKKAIEIIMSGEKPKVTENVFRVLSTRLIKYKNLTIHLNPKGNTVWYKDFTFNEENSKMLSNLYESLKKGVF